MTPSPHDIEKLAEALYEHDRSHSLSRMPQWKMASTRKQERYRGLAEVAYDTMQTITGTG